MQIITESHPVVVEYDRVAVWSLSLAGVVTFAAMLSQLFG